MSTQAPSIVNGCAMLRNRDSKRVIGVELVRYRLQIARHLLLSMGFVSLYLVLALPGTVFISRLGITAWYPANGLVLALLIEASPWYAILVAFTDAFAGAVIYHQPILSLGETAGAASVAGLYALAAIVLRGPLRIDSRLQRGRDVVRYVLVATVAAMASTVTGVACLIVDHTVSKSDYWTTASNWFIGDEIGLLALAPFLLIHIFPWVRQKLADQEISVDASSAVAPTRKYLEKEVSRLWEAAGQALAMFAVLWIMFGPWWRHLELLYLSFIPILWIAMRQGIRRTATGIVALNFGIVFAMHVFPPPSMLLDRIGILMLVASGTGLIVGSTVTERHNIDSELYERTTYLNALIENNPLGIAVLDRNGGVEMTNPAFANLFECEQLIGVKLDSLLPPSTPGLAEHVSGQPAERALRRTTHTQRKSGRKFDLELQAVPLVIDGTIRGAYTICRDISEEVRASKAEREHTEALSHMVQEMEIQNDQMTLLNEMAGFLECCATTKEACSVVDQFARRFFPKALSGALYTFRASRNLVEQALCWGDSEGLHPVFTPQTCWALRRGQPHWSHNRNGVACEHLADMPAGEYLCLPMVGQGETLGILQLRFPAPSEKSDPQISRQRLAAAVAAQVALSFASLQSREKLRDQSIRDPLTGLFNRRFAEESLERELIRAKRKSQPLSILFMDIDHFKRFNDTFGHDAGDMVLQAVADLLRKFFRSDDVACRWGGEEFAVILPDSPAQHAALRADALRGEVKSLALRYRGVALAPVTISAGIAAFPEHASTDGDLFKIADQCLYEAKSAGRDCVTVAAAHTKKGLVSAP
jgi:diguanylate cyclase (GGDEF)-like protein/PAS domain S-box-containing protein